MPKKRSNAILSADDFNISDANTKEVISRIIRMTVLATNKHKLDYGSIRYIHRQVIKRTKLAIPRAPKKLYELPTSEELDRFFGAINDPQIKMLFSVIHNCGLRVAEVCSIKVSKVDFQNHTIFITGKGCKDRLVPITPKLAERIQLFLSGRNNIYLFESKLGTQYSTRRIEQICQEIKSKAGITKKLTPHTFRHFFYSKLAESGLDVDIRALMAGHSSTRTQEVYSHLGLAGSKDLIIETLEKLEANKILK